MGSREVNLQAADQLMQIGSEALSKNIQSEVDAKKAEKIMKVEDVIVNKLIPMKASGQIDSRQMIKSVILAGHAQGLDRQESLNVFLAMEKIDQLLQARTGASLRDSMDIDLRKLQIEKGKLDVLKGYKDLAPQQPDEGKMLDIAYKRGRNEKQRLELEEANKPLAVRKTEDEIASAVAKQSLGAIQALNKLQNKARATTKMTKEDKLDYLTEELNDIYQDAGLENYFGVNQPESLEQLAGMLANHLRDSEPFIGQDEKDIRKALITFFDKPNQDIGAILTRITAGSPKSSGGGIKTNALKGLAKKVN